MKRSFSKRVEDMEDGDLSDDDLQDDVDGGRKEHKSAKTQTTADLTNVDGFDSFDSVKAVQDSSSPVSQKTAISPSTENDKSAKIVETFGDMVESTQEAPVTRRKTRSLSFAPVQGDKKEGSKSAESSPSTNSSVATTATLNSHCKSLTPLECLNVQSKADLGDLVTLEDTQSYRTDSSTISAMAEIFRDTLNISPIDFNQLQNSEEISPIPVQSNLLSLDNFIDKDKALRIVRHLFEDGADLDELRPKLQRITSDLADNLPVVNVIDDFLHEPDSDLSIFVVKLITVVENLPHSDLGSFVNKLVDVFGRDQVLKCLTVDMKIDDFKDTFKSFLEKLDGDECRNGFLLWTMQFVGAKLPSNMTTLKAQFEVLHDQFNKITE